MNETDPVTFTCSATGIPPPEITWIRNGVPFSNTRVTLSNPTMPELYPTDGGNIFLVSRNLTLANTMDADSGTYTCVASNGNAVTPNDTQDFELFVNGKLNNCTVRVVWIYRPPQLFFSHLPQLLPPSLRLQRT